MTRRPRQALLLAAVAALAGCPSEPAPPSPGLPAGPKPTGGGTAAPTGGGATPTPNGAATPSVTATNKPSVRVSTGPTPTPTPTPEPDFGPLVAGLTGDGDGRDPLKFPFDALGDLEVTDDGALYVSNSYRIWRLRPGQPLELVAGGHRARVADLDGKAGRDAGFGEAPFVSLHPDDGKAILVAHDGGLTRLKPDGKLERAWKAGTGEEVGGIVAQPEGAFALLVKAGGATPTWAWWRLRPGAAPLRLRAAGNDEAAVLRRAQGEALAMYGGLGPVGAALDGALAVRTKETGFLASPGLVFSLAVAGGEPTQLAKLDDRAAFLDGRGKLYRHDGAGGLTRATPGKAEQAIGGKLPATAKVTAITSAADGTVYVAAMRDATEPDRQWIYKLKGDDTDVIGGLTSAPIGEPGDTALRPTGLVFGGERELLVADQLRGQILRVRPGRAIEVALGSEAGPEPTEGGPAAGARLKPGDLARDGQGRLYVLHGPREVWRVEADGKLKRLYAHPVGPDAARPDKLERLAVAPDGTAWAIAARQATDGTTTRSVLALDGEGAAKALDLGGTDISGIAVAPDGALAAGVAAKGPTGDAQLRLVKWTAAKGVEEVARRGFRASPFGLAVLGVDRQGRWWLATGVEGSAFAGVTRFDPAAGSTKLVAGLGAEVFGGDTRDAGLTSPSRLAFDGTGEAFVADDLQIKRLAGVAP